MNQNNVSIAENYYTTVGEKNIAALEKFLHPDVEFVGPLAKMTGREKVLEATRKFAILFRTLKIRSRFSAGNQAVVIYDLEFPEPIGSISSASLMTFEEGAIVKIELFYDARPFDAN
jgi:ketosteroid isomerase-like protein